MTELTSESDRSVRQAVEAYLSGALRPHFQGEAQFETRNSRYRLADGVLFHVGRDGQSDGHFIGAELVGWLYEGPEDSRIDATWRPGARAVLVDAHRSRRIVVTSATRGYACVPVPATGSRAPQTRIARDPYAARRRLRRDERQPFSASSAAGPPGTRATHVRASAAAQSSAAWKSYAPPLRVGHPDHFARRHRAPTELR